MKIFICNWKMAPDTLDGARDLFRKSLDIAASRQDVLTVICPPLVHLVDCSHILERQGDTSVRLGAQAIGFGDAPTLTGACSARMIKNVGAQYVLIGHSERRYLLHESSDIISLQIQAAFDEGLIPVVFVGERERGLGWQDEIIDQLTQSVSGVSLERLSSIVYVYEPVWAISSKNKAVDFDEAHIREAGQYIRDAVAKITPAAYLGEIVLLYGGSVNESSIRSLNEISIFSGGVIGGASLSEESLAALYKNIRS